MDRLVVRGAVAHEVQLLQTERNIVLTLTQIRVTVGERQVNGGNPE
ncbi:MAG: hypothetical protein ACK5LO_08870 [Leucobacter sp.]